MRKITWTVSLLGVLALPAPSSAQHHPAGNGPADAARPALHVPYADLQWQPIVPELGADSPQVSVLRVDPRTQATQLLIRVPKQMHVPMHWHSANETHTMIKGTMVFEHDGQRHELGPGGFNYVPARTHHQAWSSDDALVFITVDSGWDINWLTGPPTRVNLGQRPPTR
jgi:mannose-6-phosphate isomerase-like protein (cupin superfamily)